MTTFQEPEQPEKNPKADKNNIRGTVNKPSAPSSISYGSDHAYEVASIWTDTAALVFGIFLTTLAVVIMWAHPHQMMPRGVAAFGLAALLLHYISLITSYLGSVRWAQLDQAHKPAVKDRMEKQMFRYYRWTIVLNRLVKIMIVALFAAALVMVGVGGL